MAVHTTGNPSWNALLLHEVLSVSAVHLLNHLHLSAVKSYWLFSAFSAPRRFCWKGFLTPFARQGRIFLLVDRLRA
jgi:hypothetical protein